MAFGLLASVVPEVNKTTTLYSSVEDVTVQGKVVVSNKNYNPVKVRLGITSGPSTSYIEYNKIVNYGETFETEDIYFGDGQSLIIRTDSPSTDFLFYGQTYVDSNPVKSGLLGVVNSTNTSRKVLFEAPIQSQAIVSLSICNLDSFPAKARVGITSAVGFNTSNYIEYDVEVLPFQTYNRKELLLDAGQSLICSSNKDSNLSFTCHGRLYYIGGGGGGAEDNLVVLGNARIDGNVGIGTLLARAKLDVIGNTLLSGNLTVGGELVANLSPSSVNTALVGLGTLPSLDGSALTGVIATGSGVEVRSNGEPVGTARTLDFGGGNLAVDFSQGSANIRTTEDIYVPLRLTVGQNKFTVNGLTGNSAIGGYVSIASTLSVNGDVNILNNKVKNVGIPTVPNDATNKSYVDARSIIMSIALS